MSKKLVFIVMLFFVSSYVMAQFEYSGVPLSFELEKENHFSSKGMNLEEYNTFTLPPLDNDVLKARELDANNKRVQFAHAIEVDITTNSHGKWKIVDDYCIWQLAIESETAYSLNLIFSQYKLPEGASLFIYNPDKTTIYGAYTANNNQPHGKFAIRPFPGNKIILEYNAPLTTKGEEEIRIKKVNHDYKGISGVKFDSGRRPGGVSGACEIDVNCVSSRLWQVLKQSVVRLVVDGKYLCTGSIVNNQKQDATPYVLSAGHCFLNNNEIDKSYTETTCVTFNYESPACKTIDRATNQPIDGFTNQTMVGGIARAWGEDLDFMLFELNNEIPVDYQAVYAGWDSSLDAPESAYSIHHPNGDVKKISNVTTSLMVSSYSRDEYRADSFWRVLQWNMGTTEGGSSGGPIYSPNGSIIGTLTGGAADCNLAVNDFYSIFSYQYNLYANSNRQLKAWLDPSNTGITKLGRFSPRDDNDNYCFSRQNYPIETHGNTVLYNETGEPVIGNNNLLFDEIAEYFESDDEAYITSVRLVVGDVFPSSQVVSLKLYDEKDGLPNSVLHEQKILANSKLVSNVENFITLVDGSGFPKVVQTKGSFFVSISLDRSNANNEFSFYSAPASNSTVFVLSQNNWKNLNTISEFNSVSRSLLLTVNCCKDQPTGNSSIFVEEDEIIDLFYDETNKSTLYLVTKEMRMNAKLSIINSTGQIVERENFQLSQTPYRLDLNNFPKGVYSLLFDFGDQKMISRKVILR